MTEWVLCSFTLACLSAMVVICLTFIPIYHKYKVYTAYEYLEKRFDLNSLAAILFLFQRGLGTGIFMPRNHLSAILGWNLNYMTIAIGVLVIIYTFQGDKSGKRDPKTANVRDYVGYVDHFFLILHSAQ
jgi:Na+/proline symporter